MAIKSLASSAIVIQRAFRQHQFIKKSKVNSSTENNLLEKSLKEDFARLRINMPPPLPKQSFPVDQNKAKEWINSHPKDLQPIAKKIIQQTVHRSQKQFETMLRMTLNDFMKTMMSYPENQRQYILVLPNDCNFKSTGWVAGLSMQYLRHKPQAVMTMNEAIKYLHQYSDIKHLLFVDDCIYSGKQISGFIKSFVISLQITLGMNEVAPKGIHFHLGIPFISLNGLQTILTNNKDLQNENNITLHTHHYQPVLSMGNFTRIGIFNDDEFNHLLASQGSNTKAFQDLTTLYFDHKIADHHSTLFNFFCGDTIDGKNNIDFIDDHCPPYYVSYKK